MSISPGTTRRPDPRTEARNPAGETSGTGGRRKLAPDPLVRAAILSAATDVVRRKGVGALSIAGVLAKSELGTRAFYRHFASKDELISALFLEMAQREADRLAALMAAAPDPVRAVAAWIDGRLDLAIREDIGPELRRMSMEAQSQMAAAPELVGPAYREMLRPLVEQLERGGSAGLFTTADAVGEALSIQGAVWSNVERRWTTERRSPSQLREHVQRFCLRGLGVDPATIDAVLEEPPPRRKPIKRKTSKVATERK